MTPSTTTEPYRFFQDGSSNEVKSRILNADPRSVEYEVLYFQISCIAATARHILEYGKASWTDRYPKDWKSSEKFDTPFGMMPVLQIESDEGEATITESTVIDLFLAKKFDLLGSSEYEEQTIKAFYSSIHFLRERCLQQMSWTWADKRKVAFEEWTTQYMPDWIRIHELHLERNGANGHFFGDKISVADIHFVSLLDHLAEVPRGDELVALFRESPLLWKVRETVLQNKEIAEWRASEIFQNLVLGGKKVYSATAFEDKSEE
ncbi:hypothetical protein EDD21DRAFT_374699 [Dissophora ornata]|nr:Glutathione S-transferase S1 [Dissophora ornata]KAI8601335.1 hypothetical protein EDD21DRAFT_374699 [Dissophora ornata]